MAVPPLPSLDSGNMSKPCFLPPRSSVLGNYHPVFMQNSVRRYSATALDNGRDCERTRSRIRSAPLNSLPNAALEFSCPVVQDLTFQRIVLNCTLKVQGYPGKAFL